MLLRWQWLPKLKGSRRNFHHFLLTLVTWNSSPFFSLSKSLQFNAVNQNNKSSLATNKGKKNNKIKLSTASDQSRTNNNRNISILVSGVKAASLFTESNTGWQKFTDWRTQTRDWQTDKAHLQCINGFFRGSHLVGYSRQQAVLWLNRLQTRISHHL